MRLREGLRGLTVHRVLLLVRRVVAIDSGSRGRIAVHLLAHGRSALHVVNRLG